VRRSRRPVGAKYPLLALDLDGTLLDHARRISPRTRDAVRRARDRGVTILLASARPPRSMLRFYQELDLDTPLIAYNGALVAAALPVRCCTCRFCPSPRGTGRISAGARPMSSTSRWSASIAGY
jgi:hypothetical protein